MPYGYSRGGKCTCNIFRLYVGSEEMEPGSGWDYTAIGNFLS